jgi:single-strand DNA-binding protein
MISVTVIGNVAQDPRVSEVNGTEVANFTVISNSKFKGEDVASAVEAAVWGSRAGVIKSYVHKGDKICVTGTGRIEVFEKKDGTSGAKLSIQASDFSFASSKSASAKRGEDDL